MTEYEYVFKPLDIFGHFVQELQGIFVYEASMKISESRGTSSIGEDIVFLFLDLPSLGLDSALNLRKYSEKRTIEQPDKPKNGYYIANLGRAGFRTNLTLNSEP